MKPTEIRIKIAEACGWKWGYGDPTKKADGLRYWSLGEWKWPDNAKTYHELPAYESDLNAMHEAEKTLLKKDSCCGHWETYSNRLATQMGPLDIFHAAASERAEAFLKTLGLWEEDIPANAESTDGATQTTPNQTGRSKPFGGSPCSTIL